MAGETTIVIVGNLTDTPELRATPSGVMVAKFTVASTPRTLDRQSGEWRDGTPLFMACTAWREMAEHIAESLDRGMRVIVQGRLKQENWEDKDSGAKRSRLVLEVDEVGPALRYATAKVTKAQGSGGGASQSARGGFGTSGTQSGGAGSSFDDEPPF